MSITSDIQEILMKMLKHYDAVEVKKVNGKLQFIGINRKLETQINVP